MSFRFAYLLPYHQVELSMLIDCTGNSVWRERFMKILTRLQCSHILVLYPIFFLDEIDSETMNGMAGRTRGRRRRWPSQVPGRPPIFRRRNMFASTLLLDLAPHISVVFRLLSILLLDNISNNFFWNNKLYYLCENKTEEFLPLRLVKRLISDRVTTIVITLTRVVPIFVQRLKTELCLMS